MFHISRNLWEKMYKTWFTGQLSTKLCKTLRIFWVCSVRKNILWVPHNISFVAQFILTIWLWCASACSHWFFLCRKYAAIVFITNCRFETLKKKLHFLTFDDFAFCANQMIENWSYSSKGEILKSFSVWNIWVSITVTFNTFSRLVD